MVRNYLEERNCEKNPSAARCGGGTVATSSMEMGPTHRTMRLTSSVAIVTRTVSANAASRLSRVWCFVLVLARRICRPMWLGLWRNGGHASARISPQRQVSRPPLTHWPPLAMMPLHASADGKNLSLTPARSFH